ncbi:hypothetical protein BH23PSE1_BH23PSE1_01600 [soil metagenome]
MLPDIKTLKSIRTRLKSRKKHKKIKERLAAGYSQKLGFLHIPKTGGSSLGTLGRALVRRGHRFPCHFPHPWRAREILEAFPAMQLVLVLRDPLERAISGFNSRLRQGRPTYDNLWSGAEAAAFAHFPSARAFLEALASEGNEHKRSAAAYAMRKISHLRWNYSYYFRDADFVRQNAGRFALIGDIARMDAFVRAAADLAGAPPDEAAALYARRHEAAVRPSRLLDAFEPDALERIRAHFAKDYAIHAALRDLAEAR